jgi:hypothetical protein
MQRSQCRPGSPKRAVPHSSATLKTRDSPDAYSANPPHSHDERWPRFVSGAGCRRARDPPICASASVCWDSANPRAEQGDLCVRSVRRHGRPFPAHSREEGVPHRGDSPSAAGQAAGLGRTGRPGFVIGDRRAVGGLQPFPAPWIFRVGMFRLNAAGSRDSASRTCRSHATVTTILPRACPCSTVRRPWTVSARG